jgi:hypothetical protein
MSTSPTAVINLRLSGLTDAGDPAVITHSMLQAYFPDKFGERLMYRHGEINFDPEDVNAIAGHTTRMDAIAVELDRQVDIIKPLVSPFSDLPQEQHRACHCVRIYSF